ncbi:hypothetical protein HYT55_02420 [Candidatus Woesearchaeota archaeon]|nr:hypothetical protein [Candidatus Woesearchaeota archaeon]
MEQKQLDEMDESFFAEEYIEEEVLDEDFLDELDAKEAKVNSGKGNPFASAVNSSSRQEEKEKKEKPTLRKLKETKPLKTVSSKVDVKASPKADLKKKEEALMDEIVITPVKSAAPVKEEKLSEKKNSEKNSPSVEPRVSEAKTDKTPKYVESAPPVDPWADEKKGKEFKNTAQAKSSAEVKSSPDNGLFKDVSTWKALTGITIILLLFSVFTQGFQFSEKTVLAAGPQLTLKEAETKALSFVNENLLTAPFVAQVVSSVEAGDLYQITLSVAGQTVDSYLTKDGKLFFPQGLDTSLNLGAPSAVSPTTTAPSEAPSEDVPPTDSKPTTVDASPSETPTTVSSTQTVEVTLNAKRWLFNPPVVTVKKGSTIVFNIQPENVDFTFALPGLGVQQEIKGPTKVTVVADTAGAFEYTCSSCEEWRGMKGTLFVE